MGLRVPDLWLNRLWQCAAASLWVWLAGLVAPALAEPPSPAADALPPVLSLNEAVDWTLLHNPELMAVRQQHGIAAAAVVIAQTYPFNPVWEGKVRDASGPASAGITNVVSNEHKFLMDVEIRHQGRYRREGAAAALSRTDWEIAFQETAVAVRVIRGHYAVLYREQKLRLLSETAELNQNTAKLAEDLVKAGQLRGTDLILARTEVDDTRALLGSSRAAVDAAYYDLRRALGAVNESFEVKGTLESAPPVIDRQALLRSAIELRADHHARAAALTEADARLRLAVADRFGNPNVGPAYEYDPTRISLIGVQVSLPLPVFNKHRGEILQREAERTRAALDLRQVETTIQQDVHAALTRLQDSWATIELYRNQVLPNLQKAVKELEELVRRSAPGADILHVIDIRRKQLRAREGYLDALWEASQARCDLAAAVGDLAMAINSNETNSNGVKGALSGVKK
jgi:cobalt-zinc-cadmium efflux system outer membrane protein